MVRSTAIALLLASACASAPQPIPTASHTFLTIEAAARDAGRALLERDRFRENAAIVLRAPDGGYTWQYAGRGDKNSVAFDIPRGAVATIHSHIWGDPGCSERDLKTFSVWAPQIAHFVQHKTRGFEQCRANDR